MIGAEIATLENKLNLSFINKTLLQQAFIHRSYLNELAESTGVADNERLEFLGDSVLQFVLSKHIYLLFPDYKEGQLTNLRGALERSETLARLAKQLDLDKYLWLGRGEEDSQGRTREAMLCDVFEAFVGALYIDQDLPAVNKFLLPLLTVEINRAIHLDKDPKTRLQQWAQREKKLRPRYSIAETRGPDHDKTFVTQVTLDKQIVGVAQRRNTREADQAAAAMALHRFGLPAPEYQPDSELEARYGLR